MEVCLSYYSIVTNGYIDKYPMKRMAGQWAETIVEIMGTLADIRGTTK